MPSEEPETAEHAQTVEEPDPEEHPSEKPPAVRETKVRKRSAFAIPKSLDDIDLSAHEEAQDEEDEAEGEKFSLDESVQLDQEVFLEALYKIVSELKVQNKHSLVSILKPENSRLEFNRWTLTVPNEISRKQMEMERDVVAQLRDLVSTPNIFLEIEVKELVNNRDAMPYTNTEKLDMMRKKNPDIDKLLKKFDAILDYRA